MSLFDFLLPLLMFAIPLGAAAYSRSTRKKRQDGLPDQHSDDGGVRSRMLTAEEIDRMLGRIPSARRPADTPRSGTAARTPLQETPKQTADGATAPKAAPERSAADRTMQKSPKEKIDKKKLIIYSEIMKPKF